ncbi:MAG: hypothetical protein LC778_10215 [Acidobacteria bacterium]|nr:hypothetical protein [Acidobacteriota bacterium]
MKKEFDKPDPDINPIHTDQGSPTGSWRNESPADDLVHGQLVVRRHEPMFEETETDR